MIETIIILVIGAAIGIGGVVLLLYLFSD